SSSVFPRDAQAGEDGVGILGVESQEVKDVLLSGSAVTFLEINMVAGGIDERLPLLVLPRRRIEHELEVHLDKTGHVFGPLNVDCHPLDVLLHTHAQISWA